MQRCPEPEEVEGAIWALRILSERYARILEIHAKGAVISDHVFICVACCVYSQVCAEPALLDKEVHQTMLHMCAEPVRASPVRAAHHSSQALILTTVRGSCMLHA